MAPATRDDADMLARETSAVIFFLGCGLRMAQVANFFAARMST